MSSSSGRVRFRVGIRIRVRVRVKVRARVRVRARVGVRVRVTVRVTVRVRVRVGVRVRVTRHRSPPAWAKAILSAKTKRLILSVCHISFVRSFCIVFCVIVFRLGLLCVLSCLALGFCLFCLCDVRVSCLL